MGQIPMEGEEARPLCLKSEKDHSIQKGNDVQDAEIGVHLVNSRSIR